MGTSAVRVRTNLFINPHFVFKTYFLKLSHISDVARKRSKILNPKSKKQDYCPIQNLAGLCLRKIKQQLTNSSFKLLDQTHIMLSCFSYLDALIGYRTGL